MQIKKHFNPVPHEHVLQWACSTRLNARNKFLYNMIFKKKKKKGTDYIHSWKKKRDMFSIDAYFIRVTYIHVYKHR